LSQVFLAIDVSKLSNFPAIGKTIQMILDDYHASIPTDGTKSVRYPGENVQKIKAANLRDGIPVLEKIWNEILSINN
jgi:3-dehydro-L-gulonate 2-dehydrogenase